MPDFIPREEFKEKLDAKIQDKIRITKEQREDQAAMDAVPTKLKWRFYLT
jgi:predicted nuclease with TOPRIM domain